MHVRAGGKHLFSRQCAARHGGGPAGLHHVIREFDGALVRVANSEHAFFVGNELPSFTLRLRYPCSPERSCPIRIWSFEGCVMTSNDVAAGLLDQLNYVGGESGASICRPDSAFDLDFDSARAWPDFPCRTTRHRRCRTTAWRRGRRSFESSRQRRACFSAGHPRRGSSSIESSTVP